MDVVNGGGDLWPEMSLVGVKALWKEEYLFNWIFFDIGGEVYSGEVMDGLEFGRRFIKLVMEGGGWSEVLVMRNGGGRRLELEIGWDGRLNEWVIVAVLADGRSYGFNFLEMVKFINKQ